MKVRKNLHATDGQAFLVRRSFSLGVESVAPGAGDRKSQPNVGTAHLIPFTNPIESTFATVRHRTIRSRGCLSNKTALAMIFELAKAAEKSWNRLRGHNQLPKVILGVTFNDGIEVVRSQAQAAAA